MKSSILNELFNLEKFKAVDDRNIERYNRELSQIDSDSAINVKELLGIIKNLGKWHLFEESMSNIKEDLLFKSDLHGISHNERVAIFVFAIGILENLNDNDLKILLEAAKYHDIGRINNGIDSMHGLRSAEKIDSLGLELTNEEKEILKTICICHSSDDRVVEEIFEKSNIKDAARCKILVNILKDADALDRVRLPRTPLDTKYLRTGSARRMVPGAYELFYNYNEVKKELEERKLSLLETSKEIDSKLFDIDQFNVIEDDENYYYFRAVTKKDISDLEGNRGLKTNRERTENEKGSAKYTADSKISLKEVWDHIRYGHSRETNCISFSSNSNVVIDYGQRDQDRYVMIKVPKDKGENVYNAGQYMLEEVNKEINNAIKQIPEGSEILNILKRIDLQHSYRTVRTIVADVYDGVKKTNGSYTGKNNKIKSKESIISRFDKKQYFSEEQQLEYNKIIAKLTVLEAMGELKSILPTQLDNSSLIASIGMAFSSGEIIHYKDISSRKTKEISSEMLDIVSLVQQLKEKDIDKDSIKALERNLLKLINDGYQIKRENGQLYLSNDKNTIKIKELDEENVQNEKEFTIEDLYRKTNGRISYYKAKKTIEFINNVKNSKYKAYEYAEIIGALTEDKEILKAIKEECYAIDYNIISRRNNDGIQISESVNLSLDRINDEDISKEEKNKLLELIKKLNSESELYQFEEKILNEILDGEEEVSENHYFAEAIIDGIEVEKIYKNVLEDKRTFSKEEKEILVSKLNRANCKRLYKAFEKIGAKPNEISGFILNLILNEGYKGYSLEELSILENLDEIIRTNVKNNNLRNSISALRLDRALGIKDDFYEVEGTNIVLRDYQRETLENIDEIFKEKRFAGMVLPTGAGKSFVAMSEMMKFKGKNIVFIAPQNTILHQFEVHVLRNILHKKIITEEELNKLKENGEPIPKNVIKPKDFKKVLQQEFPNLKMFCYDGLSNKSEEWLAARDADFIILDELHRSGAKTWEPQIKKLIEANPKAKILGMTATPIRDVDGKDMARGVAEMTGEYTTKELIDKEHLASEMNLLDAMQDGYVVSPKIVTFDYTLSDSDEYRELAHMIEKETDEDKLKELVKIKTDMDSIIKKSEKEGINSIFAKNIQKKNGKYIIFLPQNPNSKTMSSEEYIKSEIEKVEKYFKDVNPNIKSSYLLSDRKDAKAENSKALAEFENSNSDELHLLFAVDMLNEGVHVDGIDGVVMMRPISENSKILYLQQIGRCIFSEDPENPTPDEDRPIIFDVYNNYLAQNMDREANRTTPTSDLQRLKSVINWIERHKGYVPDINSEDIKEAKKAVTLKNIQMKYKRYLEGINNTNLSESELHEIEEIINLGKQIELWDLEIPDRIIPPGERDISRNDTFKVTGTQREFIDLFKKAKEITKGKSLRETIRIKEFINLVDILSEYGIEINNNTIRYNSTLDEVLRKIPKDVRERIINAISEMNTVIDKEFKIGEEYNFVKESFYDGKAVFSQYDARDLRRYGIFEYFYRTKSKLERKPISNCLGEPDERDGFIKRGGKDFKGINIYTGTRFDEEGYDVKGYNRYGIRRGGTHNRYNFGLNGHYYIRDEQKNLVDTGETENPYGFRADGTHIETGKVYNPYGFRIDRKYKNTESYRDPQGFDIDGINEHHFGRNKHYYVRNEDGEWIDTGSVLNPQNLDINGNYWIVDEKGNPKENTYTKFGKDGYSLYNIDKAGFHKTNNLWYGVDELTGKPINERGTTTNELGFTKKRIFTAYNFGRNGNYYIKDKNGQMIDTGKKENPYGFRIDKKHKDTGTFYDPYEFNIDGIHKETRTRRDNLGFDIDGINEHHFGRNKHYYVRNNDGEWIDTGRVLNPENLDINGDYWTVDEEGRPKENTHTKFGKDGYSLYGVDKYGFKVNNLYYGVNPKTGKPINKVYQTKDSEGFNHLGINEYHFGRNKHYYARDNTGKLVDTGSILNSNGLDINSDYWIVDEYGKPKENTHTKYGKNGYSLYGVNAYGFKANKLYYGLDKQGKPKFIEGVERDPEGYDFYNVNEYHFGRNGNYHTQKYNREWVDTGSILNPQNLDKNGDYWIVDEQGKPKENTYTKFGKDGYSLYGINAQGFKKDKLYYGVNLKTGKPINVNGQERDPEGYDFYNLLENGRGRDGRYYVIRKNGVIKDITFQIFSEEQKGKFGIGEYQFGANGNYYIKNDQGEWIDTGSRLNPQKLDSNGEYWIVDEEGNPIENTHTKFDEEGYSLYGIDKRGFSKIDNLWYGIDLETGKPKYNNGLKFNEEGFDYEGYNEKGYNKKGIDRYNFDENGYYYNQDEDGNYINTGDIYNSYGFNTHRRHYVTMSALDLRGFDINGKCKHNNDSIYDENGFKQDGTYMETGEKYHNGYNAFGVDEKGFNKKGKKDFAIVFTEGYIEAVLNGNRLEYIKKYYKIDKANLMRTEEKIKITLYKAQEMYPELKKIVKTKIVTIKMMIKRKEQQIEQLKSKKETSKLEIEKLQKQNEILKYRLKYLSPAEGIEK